MIGEILEYQQDAESGALRYLRAPQLRALETHWYLRLVEATPRVSDLYRRLFTGKTERKWERLDPERIRYEIAFADDVIAYDRLGPVRGFIERAPVPPAEPDLSGVHHPVQNVRGR